jgi:CRISPR/Cas system endoribonuclease Cas6 (RAMP superfamily)
MANEKMKDCEFPTVQKMLYRLTEIWNDLAFEDIQSVFREWQIRLNGSWRTAESIILSNAKSMEIYSINILRPSYRQDF